MKTEKEITILVVDDEVDLREVIIFDLKRSGFQILEAGSGNEALAVIQNKNVDVILSDLNMPNGNGIDLLLKIRELNHEIPAFMLISGLADVPIEDVYHQGANAIIEKPFDRKTLAQALHKATWTKQEKWSVPCPANPGAALDLKLQLPGTQEARQTRSLVFGRDGFFAALKNQAPTVGCDVHFHIQFDQDLPLIMEGTGVVRWVRTQDTPEHRAGCGIEFTFLSDPCRQPVIDLIQQLNTKAFIPCG